HVCQGHEPLALLPYVRRPSGGGALVHHNEVTYAIALPAGAPWQTAGDPWLRRMHAIIAASLAELGVNVHLFAEKADAHGNAMLCFQQLTPGDLLVGSSKVVGSAQRRQRGALMQHGGILLAGSRYTPALPGILELTGRQLSLAEICATIGQA